MRQLDQGSIVDDRIVASSFVDRPMGSIDSRPSILVPAMLCSIAGSIEDGSIEDGSIEDGSIEDGSIEAIISGSAIDVSVIDPAIGRPIGWMILANHERGLRRPSLTIEVVLRAFADRHERAVTGVSQVGVPSPAGRYGFTSLELEPLRAGGLRPCDHGGDRPTS